MSTDRFEQSQRCVGRGVWARLGICTAALILLAGCSSSIGPHTVVADRYDYSSSIADSWKQQTLLNIVKLRYLDLPVFVDVSSIVAGYSMQTGVTVNGTSSSERAVQGNFVAAGAQAVYTDRPTITYVPLTGEKFLRGMITPIDPKNIFFMLQAGYSADFVLALTVESINGVRNRSTAAGSLREADPDFLRALQLLREIQAAGGMGMRVEEDKAKHAIGVIFFRREDLPADILEKGAEVRRLLKLSTTTDRFTLVYSPGRGAENELGINSRSMLQIISAFATYLDVPEEHLKDHRAIASFENGTQETAHAVRIHSAKAKPVGAFTSVYYRDHWFYIEDTDWRTKRALTAVMFFFTLSDSGGQDKLPLITIPAQ